MSPAIAAHPAQFLLYLVGLVLLLLAAFGAPSGRISLGWLGLAVIAGTVLLGPFLAV